MGASELRTPDFAKAIINAFDSAGECSERMNELMFMSPQQYAWAAEALRRLGAVVTENLDPNLLMMEPTQDRNRNDLAERLSAAEER